MREPVDMALIERAEDLIRRGWTVEEAAREAGISKTTLYNYGVRAL